jgi:hypothetical protein
MDTALKFDIEKATYELRCMAIRSEGLEHELKTLQKHINEVGMNPQLEQTLAMTEMLIEKHELAKKEVRMQLMFMYKKSLK